MLCLGGAWAAQGPGGDIWWGGLRKAPPQDLSSTAACFFLLFTPCLPFVCLVSAAKCVMMVALQQMPRRSPVLRCAPLCIPRADCF